MSTPAENRAVVVSYIRRALAEVNVCAKRYSSYEDMAFKAGLRLLLDMAGYARAADYTPTYAAEPGDTRIMALHEILGIVIGLQQLKDVEPKESQE